MTQKTTSETFFEQFCTQYGVRWEQIATESTDGVKTPDYAIFPKETKVIAEVKEIQENAAERQQREHFEKMKCSTYGGSNKLGDRARDIIGTAAKQLKRMAKGKCPAMILIYNASFLLRPSVVTPKPANGGQGKTGQREEAGDEVVLSCRLLWRQVHFRAPTPRTTFEYMTMMEKTIEHGGDGCAISQ